MALVISRAANNFVLFLFRFFFFLSMVMSLSAVLYRRWRVALFNLYIRVVLFVYELIFCKLIFRYMRVN